MTQLYLASASPRRSELLQAARIPFIVISNRLLEEPELEGGDALKSQLEGLALAKAEASGEGYSGLVMGVDTVVVLGDRVLGKPLSREDAVETLSLLSGKDHQVMTSIALWDTVLGTKRVITAESTVRFNALSLGDIDQLLTDYDVMDKAGAYGIQDIQGRYAELVSGELDTVIGLPITSVYSLLSGYDIVP
ncbi:Maf family protein [bacterium]|jgi:septum formation protein|nr:Maf family protein [bacterium]